MSISDDQFAQWLASDTKQICVLAELDYITEVFSTPNYVPTTHTLYFANRPFVSQPGHTPASKAYRECLLGTPTFSRRIDQTKFRGATQLSYGTVTLDNSTGDIDYLLNLILDGQEMRFYMGDPSWDPADFRLAVMGIVQYVSQATLKQITITLQDKMTLLNAAIENAAWTTDDQIRPIALGYVENVPVYVEDASLLLYRASWTEVFFIAEVRDSGVSLNSFDGVYDAAATFNAATDVVSITGHNLVPGDCMVAFKNVNTATMPGALTAGVSYYVINSGFTPDAFKVSTTKGGSALNITSAGSGNLFISGRGYYTDNTNGEFTLATDPQGQLTCDVWAYTGDTPGSIANKPDTTSLTYIDTPMSVLLAKLIGSFSKLVVTDDYLTARMTAWSDGVTSELLGVYIPARTNLLEVLDFLSRHVFGWYGFDRSGVLDFGKLIAPEESDPVTFAIGANDFGIDDISISQAFTPVNKVRVGINKNWTVQADGLAGAVSAASRTRFAQEYLYTDIAADETTTVAYSAAGLAPLRYHRQAITAQPIDTAAYGVYATSVVASGIFDQFLQPQLQIITIKGMSLQYWQVALGSIGSIGTGALNRLGIGDPTPGERRVLCIGIDTDITGQSVTLTLLRRNIPDVATQTYA